MAKKKIRKSPAAPRRGPKPGPEKARRCGYSVYLSGSERADVERAARREGKRPAAWLREIALECAWARES